MQQPVKLDLHVSYFADNMGKGVNWIVPNFVCLYKIIHKSVVKEKKENV